MTCTNHAVQVSVLLAIDRHWNLQNGEPSALLQVLTLIYFERPNFNLLSKLDTLSIYIPGGQLCIALTPNIVVNMLTVLVKALNRLENFSNKIKQRQLSKPSSLVQNRSSNQHFFYEKRRKEERFDSNKLLLPLSPRLLSFFMGSRELSLINGIQKITIRPEREEIKTGPVESHLAEADSLQEHFTTHSIVFFC